MAKLQVHEVRKLMLPIETAVDAVLELDCEQGGLLAFGTIVAAQIESEPEPGLLVVVQRRGTETTERRKFEFPILAAAFIRYCWKCRIPLPRQGAKRIEIGPEGFIFTIEGTVEVVRRHGAVPQRAAVPAPAAPDEVPEQVASAPVPAPVMREEAPEQVASAN
jgi:hypothetical protein